MNKSISIHITQLLLSLLIISSPALKAQTALYDSLKATVDTMEGINKVLQLQEAAQHFMHTSLDKGLYFANESEKILSETQNDSLLAVNHNLIGNLYTTSGLYSMSEKHYISALEIYEKIGDFDGKATETHNLGIVYKKRNDTIKAIDYFKQSLDARYMTNNNRRIGDGLTTLGEIYMDFGEFERSITCLTRALEYYTDQEVYMRKYECYAFLADNFLSIDPAKSLANIRQMEIIARADSLGKISGRYKIDFRLGQYHLANGNIQEAAKVFNRINLEETDFSDEFKPIETLRELSDKLYEKGEIKEAIRFSVVARNNKKEFEDKIIKATISEYKARLDLRSTEEDILRTEESNMLVIKRIHAERRLQLIALLILIVLTTTIAILLITYFNLKRDQAAMSARNIELQEANEKSKAYKESILRFRENKSIFFNILSDKLLIPFTDLTSRLTSLSENARLTFNKEKFLTELGNIYNISISIEKSLKRILIWSKLQRRKYDVNSEYININDYLYELLPEILKMAVRQSIKVSYDIDPGLSVIFDRKSLRSIIKVFVENSIDNSKKKSEIIIRSKKARNGGIISVTDFGSGIPPDIQKNLFDIKKREIKVLNSDYKKLGLGLLMSKHLAELNNSYISFESKLNKGTTFYLHIKEKNGREETNV